MSGFCFSWLSGFGTQCCSSTLATQQPNLFLSTKLFMPFSIITSVAESIFDKAEMVC